MKAGAILIGITGTMLVFAASAFAQADREDVMWARVAPSITLDGFLNEPAWAQAESVVIRFGVDNGVPGSGWKYEGGNIPNDPTLATLKLLTVADSLYLGAVVRDASIGGSRDFNRFDGFLMALKDHLAPDSPKPPAEYFYAWWYAEGTDPQPAGQSPAFIGRWAEWPPGTPRTPEQIAELERRDPGARALEFRCGPGHELHGRDEVRLVVHGLRRDAARRRHHRVEHLDL